MTRIEQKEFKAMHLSDDIMPPVPIKSSINTTLLGGTALSIENLLALDESTVPGLVKAEFLKQIKNASSIQKIFFSNPPACIPPKNPLFIDDLACGIIFRTIAQSSLYGFSKTVDYTQANAFVISQLTSTDAFQDGAYLYDQYFLIACSAQGHTFQEYLQSQSPTKEAWGAQLAVSVTTDQFINVEIAKIIAEPTGQWQYQLNVILHKLDLLNPAVKSNVLQKWQAVYSNIQDMWGTYRRIGLEDIDNDQFLADVNRAISLSTSELEDVVFTSAGRGVPIYTYVYGEAVASFLEKNHSRFNFITGNAPSNKASNRGGSCFTGNTLILLEHGDSTPINQIRQKDRVVGEGGIIAIHSDEKVVQEFERDTIMYGFNDEKPFFTSGHPFLTKEGWKAIDVQLALEENPTLEVSELKSGDSILKVKLAYPLTYEEVKISDFSKDILPAGSKVYGLHLHDGPASYHANGYCVRMNYPIITVKRLTDGFAKLSSAEKRLLLNQLSPVMPLLTKAIGSFVASSLSKSLAIKPRESATFPQLKKGSAFSSHLSSLPDKDYFIQIFDEKSESHKEKKELASLAVRKGKFIFNGQKIVPKLTGSSLVWVQKTKDNYVAGSLLFSLDKLSFSGSIIYGMDEKNASTYTVTGITPPSVYTSILQDANSNKVDGLMLRLSYRLDPGNPLPIAVLEVSADRGKKWTDISGTDPQNPSAPMISWYSSKNGTLIIQFPFVGEELESLYFESLGLVWPAKGSIEFSLDADSFLGQMQSYDSKAQQPNSIPYQWKGAISTKLVPALLEFKELFASPPLLRSTELTLMNLVSIMPSAQAVSDMSFKMLTENMKWAISKMNNNWLSDFFGEIPPFLSEERQTLVNESLDFYQNKFATAYLGWGIGQMTGTGGPTTPLSPEETRKLKYYLNVGLGKEADYTKQTQSIFSQAYAAAAISILGLPGIEAYIEDGGEKWAKLFHDNYLTTPQQINNLVFRIVSDPSGTMSIINQNAALLSVLQPNKQYANQYLQELLNKGLISHMKGALPPDSPEVKAELERWVPDFIKAFIDKYINTTGGDESSLRAKQLAIDLDAAIATLGGLVDLSKAFSLLLTAIMMKKQGRNIFDSNTIEEAEKQFSTNNPRLAKVLGFIKIVGVGFSLFSIYVGFSNWDKISDEKRAEIIVATLNLVDPVMDILGTLGRYTINALNKIRSYFRPLPDMQLIDAGDPEVRAQFNSLFQETEEGADVVIEGTSLLAKFIGQDLAKIVLKAMGPIMAAAFAGFSLYTFAEDIINGESATQTAFDGVMAGAAVGVLICSIIDTLEIAALAQFSAFAGPFCVIVGVVFALIEAFLPKPHPESPADKFMSILRSSFLSKQDNPPDNWEPLSKKTAAKLLRLQARNPEDKEWKRIDREEKGYSARTSDVPIPASVKLKFALWKLPPPILQRKTESDLQGCVADSSFNGMVSAPL